jgi:CheY-like chemotaxis protein
MTKPLALVCYERLLPGSQLVNRLQDLGYRVQAIADASLLHSTARQDMPMFAFVDLKMNRGDVFQAIKAVRSDQQTGHIPVLGFSGLQDKELPERAMESGATFVALDDALLPQLPHLLDQMLHVE